MDDQILQKLGLNAAQTKTYLLLVRHGKQTPPQVAEEIGETRTNAYNLLNQLTRIGLVEKSSENRTFYQAKNPSVLKQLLVKRNQELGKTSTELSAILPSLQSTYRLTHNQPGVVQAEGTEALQLIYDDIIKNVNEPLIFASAYDRDDPETNRIIDEQIARQQSAGLRSSVIISKLSYSKTELEQLKKQQVTVRQVLSDEIPAQIMIYGDNIAFTAFRNGINSTVITNPEIAQSMRAIFRTLWEVEASDPSNKK